MIGKYNGRSFSVDKKPYYENRRRRKRSEKQTKKRHWWLLLITVCLLAAIVITAGLYLTLPGVRRASSVLAGSKELSQSLVQSDPETIPEFNGSDYVELNDNRPLFSEGDSEQIHGEYYSPLDALGRCSVVYANIESSMRPTEERGSIGMIKPSG